MPQNRKALAGIEQTGDRRTKVPLACFILIHSCGVKSMLPYYYVEKIDEVKEMV